MFTGLLQNEITVRDVIGSPQRTLVRSLAVLWFWKNRQWSVQNRHFKQRYSIMGLHNVFSIALLLYEKSRFFQKRYALSGLLKKRYSVVDPINSTLCVIGVFSSSVMALWVLSKKRHGVMKDPLRLRHFSFRKKKSEKVLAPSWENLRDFGRVW